MLNNKRSPHTHTHTCIHNVHVHTDIYIYRERKKERKIERERESEYSRQWFEFGRLWLCLNSTARNDLNAVVHLSLYGIIVPSGGGGDGDDGVIVGEDKK